MAVMSWLELFMDFVSAKAYYTYFEYGWSVYKLLSNTYFHPLKDRGEFIWWISCSILKLFTTEKLGNIYSCKLLNTLLYYIPPPRGRGGVYVALILSITLASKP